MKAICKQRDFRLLLILLLFAGPACTKFVTVPPPTTEVTAEGAFSNDAGAEATVTGLYGQIMTGSLYFLNGANTVYPALSADELQATFADASTDAFVLNAITPDNPIVNFDLWGRAYSYLYQINACLEGLAAAPSVTEKVKVQLSSEVKFMRALTLFYLTNLYGDIPLPLSTNYTENARLPRTPTDSVYRQIVTDLTSAKYGLPEANVPTSATRPSYYACAALMARVALYRKNWTEAAAEADTVIKSGVYTLEDASRVFTAGNSEAIFSLAPVIPYLNTAEGLYFIPYDPSSVPLFTLTDSLVASFEAEDERKAQWTASNEANGVASFYPFKYKVKSGSDVTEHYVVLRLAEMYLIRAEARAENGDVTGAAADMNVIRERAGLPPLPDGLSKPDLISRVMRENRAEFFCEWGHRWLDLKRTGVADEVLGYKSGWTGTDTLYPIPSQQLLLNPALVQNAGY